MPGPEIAEAIGRALTAGRPDARYSVGLDAPFVRLAERLLPDRVHDRLIRVAMGR